MRFVLRRFHLLELVLVFGNPGVHNLLKNVSDLGDINHGVVLKLELPQVFILDVVNVRLVHKKWFGFLLLVKQDGLDRHFLAFSCFGG